MNKKEQTPRKLKFWLLYHFGILAFSILVAMVMKYSQTGNAFHSTVIPASASIFLFSIGIGYLAHAMLNRLKKYTTSQLRKKIIPSLILFYILSILIVNVSITITTAAWFLYLGKDFSGFWTHMFEYELNFASIRLLVWLMIFTIIFFYVLWRKSVEKEQKLREENLKFRYISFKSQVNPHFLFNSLNTLSELVFESAEKADNYVRKLSGIYRYILDNEDKELIPLKKELEFVNDYFQLQKVRDNDKIILEIDVPDQERYKVLPVSLQLLVENALKHNTKSQKDPLRIRIYRNGECIVVENKLQKKSNLEDSNQTGLSNLRERVNLITQKELIVTAEKEKFIVEFPLISDSYENPDYRR
jgi:two-component sensor histidine kinase